MLRYLFFLLRLSSDPSNTFHTYTLWIVYMCFLVYEYCVCMSIEYTYIDNIQTQNHMNMVRFVCLYVCMRLYDFCM